MDINHWQEKYDNVPRQRIEREHYTVFHVYKHGEKIATLTGRGFTGERKVEYFGEYKKPKDQVNVETLMKLYTVEKIFNEELFKKARQDATAALNAFWEEFKQALFEDHGIQNHPKRERFFEILRSNNSSPSAIYDEALSWVDLLK